MSFCFISTETPTEETDDCLTLIGWDGDKGKGWAKGRVKAQFVFLIKIETASGEKQWFEKKYL